MKRTTIKAWIPAKEEEKDAKEFSFRDNDCQVAHMRGAAEDTVEAMYLKHYEHTVRIRYKDKLYDVKVRVLEVDVSYDAGMPVEVPE